MFKTTFMLVFYRKRPSSLSRGAMIAVIVVYDASVTSETRRRPLEATQTTQKYQIEAINWEKQLKCVVITILEHKWEGYISYVDFFMIFGGINLFLWFNI